ncbi:hypothetical protein F4860DRAFT_516198 [Xylaria cubensis]|nr:hypothetical protein F4860DRAFT_516198 [Xylaria cubensis]
MSTPEAENPGPQSKEPEEPKEPDKKISKYDDYTQDFPAMHINTTKLMTILTARFGLGGYDIWMMRNRFYIKASGKLSEMLLAKPLLLSLSLGCFVDFQSVDPRKPD